MTHVHKHSKHSTPFSTPLSRGQTAHEEATPVPVPVEMSQKTNRLLRSDVYTSPLAFMSKWPFGK